MKRPALVLCLALFAGCSHQPRIVVGSKNFTEQVLLGEILAQQIERRLHVPVERKLDLGGTLVAHEALVKGEIDLYPEYTGTALTAILKELPAGMTAEAVRQRVSAAYANRWKLVWLPPLGFNDSFAMVVRGETARRFHMAALSDAARRTWRLGVGYEFESRPDGLAGLLRAYHLRLDGQPAVMDLGLLYPALMSGKVDMAAANTTDGLLSALDVTVLADDRTYFPPYECSVVAREQTLEQFPGLRRSLEELSGKLNNTMMRRLNYEVDSLHRPVADVAAEALKTITATDEHK